MELENSMQSTKRPFEFFVVLCLALVQASCANGMALRLRVNPERLETGSDALASVRSMLEENGNLSISASTPGIIKVTTLNVWSPVLDAKLGELKLSSLDRYNADWAIQAAVVSSEKSLEDLNARTFAGVLVYKECALPDSSHLFDFFYWTASEVPPFE
jgi:hypothetical protein